MERLSGAQGPKALGATDKPQPLRAHGLEKLKDAWLTRAIEKFQMQAPRYQDQISITLHDIEKVLSKYSEYPPSEEIIEKRFWSTAGRPSMKLSIPRLFGIATGLNPQAEITGEDRAWVLDYLKYMGIVKEHDPVKEQEKVTIYLDPAAFITFKGWIRKNRAGKKAGKFDVRAGNSIVLRIDEDRCFWFEKVLSLTPYQRKILEYLCRHPQAAVKSKDAMEFSGVGEFSKTAFKTHLTKIRAAIRNVNRRLPANLKREAKEFDIRTLIERPKGTGEIILNLSAKQVACPSC